MDRVILKAGELDGYLTADDRKNLKSLELLFGKALKIFPKLQAGKKGAESGLIKLYDEMETLTQDICRKESRIHIYSFIASREDHSEVSRLIAKLRGVDTQNMEFIYYIQRAYEMLFKLVWGSAQDSQENYLFVKTPVASPAQNYAVHRITNIDNKIDNAVMCVMLRGALLPSMIISKEIEEYSSRGYVTPFALFKICRNDKRRENNMEYILELDKSFFDPEALNGKDLIFADPMNATGGSLVAVVKYILGSGIKPRSIVFLNVISALKGALRAARALENCDVYTLWMDAALNRDAYILPGLGDAGDRINGKDSGENPRNIIQLLADYGTSMANLYRSQFREIENTVLGGKR
jgi:uracil phosphoribosyltransferase